MSPVTLHHLGFRPLVMSEGRTCFLTDLYGGQYRVLDALTGVGRWTYMIMSAGQPGEGGLFVQLGPRPRTFLTASLYRRKLEQRYYIPAAQTEWFWDNYIRVEY